MIALPILSTVAALAIAIELVLIWKEIKPEMRKALVLPSLFQIFAIYVVLVQGGCSPRWIPEGIQSGICYFFSIYLTFTSIVTFCAVGKKHRFRNAILWSIASLCFWILSICG